MTRRRGRSAVALAVGALLLSSCAGSGADGRPTGEALTGAWALLEGTSGGAPIDIPAGGRATLVVEETTLGGTAFCNGYGGEYDLDGSTLLLSGLGGTDMACTSDLMTAEEAYLTVLRGGRLDVSLEEGELVLRADEGTLRFRSLPPVAVSDLVDTRWVLESLVTGGTVSSTAVGAAVLELRSDGTVAGSTGCRRFTGTWDTFGDEVRFPDFGFDAVVECPVELASQDAVVVSVLEGFTVSIDGDVLTATGGGTTLVYRAAR